MPFSTGRLSANDPISGSMRPNLKQREGGRIVSVAAIIAVLKIVMHQAVVVLDALLHQRLAAELLNSHRGATAFGDELEALEYRLSCPGVIAIGCSWL
jgi:hypothetical protein